VVEVARNGRSAFDENRLSGQRKKGLSDGISVEADMSIPFIRYRILYGSILSKKTKAILQQFSPGIWLLYPVLMKNLLPIHQY
jgi:hypothetical protein